MEVKKWPNDSPLLKREAIWGESHLAVACGTVMGENGVQLDDASPVTIPQATARLKELCHDILSNFCEMHHDHLQIEESLKIVVHQGRRTPKR